MKTMEKSLDMSIKALLPIMQRKILNKTTYLGIRTIKNPLDLWVYQEIIYDTRPNVIIEIGNAFGGTLLALAHICDALWPLSKSSGKIIGIDLDHRSLDKRVIAHPRIHLKERDAVACFKEVKELVPAHASVLVIEDSSHKYDNTLDILKNYSTLIKPGGYFIVEDGICHHGLNVGPSPGPYEAVETFLAEYPDFEVDRTRESFLLTWNPRGFLRRK